MNKNEIDIKIHVVDDELEKRLSMIEFEIRSIKEGLKWDDWKNQSESVKDLLKRVMGLEDKPKNTDIHREIYGR